MGFINKNELKYITIAVIFGLIWFSFVLPKVISLGESQSVYIQFIVFNLGIFIMLQIFLKAHSLNSGIDLLGSIGVITLFMALDIIMPPLSVGFDGKLLSGPLLSQSASDYTVGYFAANVLHLPSQLIFSFTYILTPFILLIIASKLLPNFVRRL